MKPQVPADVLQRIHDKIKRRALSDVLRICANHSISPTVFGAELSEVVEALYQSRAYGVILSAYYDYGQISHYTTLDLLSAMFEARDYPSFLKQAHRFGVYHECAEKIEAAIEWHQNRGLKDADAWRSKFGDIRERFERNT